jgi:hypothetical protein
MIAIFLFKIIDGLPLYQVTSAMNKIIIKYRLTRLASFNLPSVFIFEIAHSIYWRNLIDRVYAPESDSIGIPIFSMLLLLTISALPLTLLALIPQTAWLSRVIAKGKFFKFIAAISICGMYTVGIIFAIGVVIGNLEINHYPIGLSHLPLLAVLCWYLSADYKWFKNQITLKATN